MTPTEVLREIRKMRPAQKQRVLRALTEQAEPESNGYSEKQKEFIAEMKRKGLITELPLGLPDDERRRNFRRVTVTGEPISETIIRERR